MGLSILDANPFIPDDSEREAAGPLAAAGLPDIAQMFLSMPRADPLTTAGLGGSSGGPSVPAPPSASGPANAPVGGLSQPGTNPTQSMLQSGLITRPFSQSDAQQVAQTMMGRIRSPEDISGHAQERQGVLDKLMEAYGKPSNTLSPIELYSIGSQMTPDWYTGAMNDHEGLALAAKQKYLNNTELGQKSLLGPEAQLGQMNKEEQYANDREKAALSNEAKILQSQTKGAGGSLLNQLGYIKQGSSIFRISPDGNGIVPVQLDPKAYDQANQQAARMANDQIKQNTYPATEEGRAQYVKDWQDAYQGRLDTLIANLDQNHAKLNANGASPQPMTNAPTGQAATKQGLDPATGQPPPQQQNMGDPMPPEMQVSPDILGNNPLMQSYAKDPLHVAVALTESNLDPKAIGPQTKLGRAKGVMQVMDSTAMFPGMGIQGVKDLNDMNDRERVGHQYLDALKQAYGGNEQLALAAYNWGPGNVSRWVNNGADPSKMPEETRNYIAKAMGYKNQLLQQPQGTDATATPDQAPVSPPAADQTSTNQPLPASGMKATGPAAMGASTPPTQPATSTPVTSVPSTTSGQSGQPASNAKPDDASLYPISGTLTPDALNASVSKYIVNAGHQQTGPMNKRDLTQDKIATQESAAAQRDYRKQVTSLGAGAKQEENQADTMIQLANTGLNTGMAQPYVVKMGKFLESLGVPDTNGIVQQGIKGDIMNGSLAMAVNDRLKHEIGTSSDQDVHRVQEQFPHLTDTNEGFTYKAFHLKELAQRKQLQAQIIQQIADKDPRANLQASWNRYADAVLGPSVLPGANGEPITRTQYLNQVTQKTMDKLRQSGQQGDETAVRHAAAKNWVDTAVKNYGWVIDNGK